MTSCPGTFPAQTRHAASPSRRLEISRLSSWLCLEAALNMTDLGDRHILDMCHGAKLGRKRSVCGSGRHDGGVVCFTDLVDFE